MVQQNNTLFSCSIAIVYTCNPQYYHWRWYISACLHTFLTMVLWNKLWCYKTNTSQNFKTFTKNIHCNWKIMGLTGLEHVLRTLGLLYLPEWGNGLFLLHCDSILGPVRQWRGTLRFLQYLGDHIFILVHPNCTITNHTWPYSTDSFHVEAVDEPTPTPTPHLPNDAVLLLDTVVPVHVCACF